MALSPRERLVETALDLFRRRGFHATGIDTILAQSGVAKMTLYNHFRSKDELIIAALRRRDESFRNWLARATERRAATPRERLLAVFESLDEWIRSDDFTGCMFINASAEFGRADDPVHAAAAEHKRLVLAYLRDLAARAGAGDAEGLARALMLLVEGAIVMAHVAGQRDAALHAKAAARVLLRDAGL